MATARVGGKDGGKPALNEFFGHVVGRPQKTPSLDCIGVLFRSLSSTKSDLGHNLPSAGCPGTAAMCQ
jgi:hypothetical protein